MKTIKNLILALTVVTAFTSCEKEVPPTPQWDGINHYKLETVKLVDNAPLSEPTDANWMQFDNIDSTIVDEGWNGSSANEVVTWELADSIPLTIFIGTGAMIPSQPKYDEYNVKIYRNDTLLLNTTGVNLQFFYPLN